MTTTAQGTPTAGPGRCALGAIWGWALAAAVVAGAVAWLGGERVHRVHDVRGEATSGQPQPAEVFERIARANLAIKERDGSTYFGFVGGLLGLALGVAGGLARRRPAAALGAGVVGLLLAGAAGAAGGQLTAPMAYRDLDQLSGSAGLTFLIHGAIYAGIGLTAGLAFGVGLGGRSTVVEAALGGLLGALAATVLYEVAGGLLLPADKTYLPIAATAAARCLAELALVLLTAIGTALLAANGIKSRARAVGK